MPYNIQQHQQQHTHGYPTRIHGIGQNATNSYTSLLTSPANVHPPFVQPQHQYASTGPPAPHVQQVQTFNTPTNSGQLSSLLNTPVLPVPGSAEPSASNESVAVDNSTNQIYSMFDWLKTLQCTGALADEQTLNQHHYKKS